MNINELTMFFGWCTLINMVVLSVSTIFLTVFRDFVIGTHSKLMGIEASELPMLYFKYLANYKVVVIVFNLAPYIALRLMTS